MRLNLQFSKSKLFLLFIFLTYGQFVYTQNESDPRSSYVIEANLDTSLHLVSGSETIDYVNNSGVTLDRIYFHLWANAYKSNNTDLITQQLELGISDQYFYSDNQRGGYETIIVKRENGQAYSLGFEDENQEVMFIELDQPMKPGDRQKFEIEFIVKIPKLISRFGRSKNYYQMTHWYPRVVKCVNGLWHAMPYLEIGEYFHDFSDYEVNLIVPKDYEIVATGIKQKQIENEYAFQAKNVTDFAWFSSSDFNIEEKTISINGQQIRLEVTKHFEATAWTGAMEKLERSVKFLSEQIGAYPFPEAKVVLSKSALGSGMEYPMITIIGSFSSEEVVDHLIVHEIGHNWFYGALSTNERRYPWLDEGLTTYYDHKYHQKYYNRDPYQINLPKFLNSGSKLSPLQSSVIALRTLGKSKRSDLHSEAYTGLEYGIAIYERPAMGFRFLEKYLGDELFSRCIKHYYEENKFSNPGPSDLQNSFESISKKDLDWFFVDYIGSNSGPDYEITELRGRKIRLKNHQKIKVPFAISYEVENQLRTEWFDGFEGEKEIELASSDVIAVNLPTETNLLDVDPRNNLNRDVKIKFFSGIDNPDQKQIFFQPYLGYNVHDGLMLGSIFYNSTFPPKRFKWFAAPAVGLTGEETGLVGLLSGQYDFVIEGKYFRKIIAGANLRRFNRLSTDDFALHYEKLKPFVRLYLKQEKHPRLTRYFEINTHLISEENVIFEDGVPEFSKAFRIAEQVKYNYWLQDPIADIKWENTLEFQQYRLFDDTPASYIKFTSTYQYKYQFAKSKFLKIRLFGSYFLQNSERGSSSFASSLARGSISLTPQGFSDHLYDDFYFGRNQQEGIFSQQIGTAEGGFKTAVGSANRIGLSNNFGFAVNFMIDTPIFIKPFFDVGYYATKTTTEADFNNETIFSIGLALEILDDGLGVYLPLFNSSQISDIYEIRSFLSRISFKIDLNRLDIWKASEDYNF